MRSQVECQPRYIDEQSVQIDSRQFTDVAVLPAILQSPRNTAGAAGKSSSVKTDLQENLTKTEDKS